MLIQSHQSMSKFILLVFLIIKTIPSPAGADDPTPECPYPCLPSPPSAGSYPPPPPPYTPSGPAYGYPPPPPGTPDYGYYPPPPPGTPDYGYYPPPPPSGYVPYYSPPYYTYPAPPPPNPILPWFPFYYKYPPPVAAASSMASCMGAASVALLTTLLGIFLL